MSTSSGPAAESLTATPAADARVLGRLAAAFVLDVVAVARGERSVLEFLLLAAIAQANVAPIIQNAKLQIAYAAASEPPPDEMRRPVSVSAIANSLNLPFETTRRRVHALVDGGFCAFVDGGVVVPTAVLSSDKFVHGASRVYERVRAFYDELRGLGLLARLPPPSVSLSRDLTPVRAVIRLALHYVLRLLDTAMASAGDLVDALIILEITRSNTEALPPDVRGSEGVTPENFVTDDLRTPVRIAVLARRLALPEETVRRHVVKLVERGLCERNRRGVLIPAEVLARPAVVEAMTTNASNLQRLFAALSQLGVLKLWDALPPSAALRSPAAG